MLLEWDETGEDSSDKQLWEDNWDDDNIEDEFSCQLRYLIIMKTHCCDDPLPKHLYRGELERLGEKVTHPEPMKS